MPVECYAPGYYKNFKCIADKCRHSCCVGWAVYVDEKAYLSYSKLGGDIGDSIRASLVGDGDEHYLKMREDGRCPMLCENGLCSIISELGDGALCSICARHPRFINILGDRYEVGLGISCEEACRTVLLSELPFSLEKSEKDEARWGVIPQNECPYGFSKSREALDVILSAESAAEALARLASRFSVSCGFHTVGEWLEILRELEYLNDEWPKLIEKDAHMHIDFDGRALILKNLLIYFVYRHTPEAEDGADFAARLGFAMLGTEICDMLFDMAAVADVPSALEICRLFSSEIEYSEDNLDALMMEFECFLPR